MTRAALRFSPVYKEVRALLFPWLVCVTLLIVARAIDWRLTAIAVFTYCIGATALGALSIGHEYTGGTLSLMLSLPAHRGRLLVVKQVVLGVLLLALAAAALSWPSWTADRFMRVTPMWVLSLPLLYGLFIAPWLTMVCRNPIAGTVFTIVTPGILWLAGGWIGVMLYGDGREMYAFRLSFFWRGTLVMCAIGFIATWRMFLTLEAIEGLGRDLGLPQWLGSTRDRSGASRLTTRTPIVLLAAKELHVQQLAIVLGLLNLLGWIGVTVVLADSPLLDAFTAISIFVAGLMAVLIGATASAGERQLGTLEWQILMPIATWKQWAVKVGVALALALLLALGLPALYASLHPALNPRQLLRPRLPW